MEYLSFDGHSPVREEANGCSRHWDGKGDAVFEGRKEAFFYAAFLSLKW